ncbi:hypothetical protein PPYR_14607 [Photinus pyralis]|uniref:Uncharacterized protein n=1 Tax=Photinus pyralis TaxID=7054 RepID=A0A5N4A5V0_PHOPY|nr:uncharacterized protein LOC116181397 [Photinus pyralis]KAB0792648.1 hypothetical protein PPYR_14607 [Photinus pyralis]
MAKISAIAFFVAVLLVLEVETQTTDDSIATRNKKVESFMSECICASGADPEEVYSWFARRTFFPSSCFKCFLKCIGRKMGFMKPDGSSDLDAVSEQFGSIISGEEIALCIKAHSGNLDLCEKAYQVPLCIYQIINANATN